MIEVAADYVTAGKYFSKKLRSFKELVWKRPKFLLPEHSSIISYSWGYVNISENDVKYMLVTVGRIHFILFHSFHSLHSLGN